MRKKLLLVFCLALCSISGYSQIGFGLRGGFGASNTSQELVSGLTRTIGTSPTYGFMANYDLDLHFSAGFEVNYTKFSESLTYSAAFAPPSRISDKSDSTAVKSTTSINYLQIPFYGRITFGEKKYKAFVSFAPFLGIALSGKWENGGRPEGDGSLIRLDATYTAQFKEGDFKKIDIGGQVGFGGQYQLGKNGVLFAEARLQIGFLDFWNDLTPLQTKGYTSVVNKYLKPGGTSWRAINISVGYYHTFKIPKKTASAAVKKAGKQR